MTLDVGIATRPCMGFKDNGDSYYTGRLGTAYLAAIMDGLGHGTQAAEASRLAVECLAEQEELSIERFYRECHERLRRTRGVAAGVAVIDEEQGRIQYTGVGNIEAIVYDRDSETTLISTNGILGGGVMPNVHVREAEFPLGALLILYSDGISGKFRLEDYSELHEQPAQFIADLLLRDWSRINDDATVIIIRRG